MTNPSRFTIHFNIFEWYFKFGCCRNKFRNFNCAVCYCHFFLIYFTDEPHETFFISLELGAKVKLHSMELIHCTYSIVCHFFHMDWIIQSFWLSFMGSSLLFWWWQDEKISSHMELCTILRQSTSQHSVSILALVIYYSYWSCQMNLTENWKRQ